MLKYLVTAHAERTTEYEKIIEANSLEEAQKIADEMTVEDMEIVDECTMAMDFKAEEL